MFLLWNFIGTKAPHKMLMKLTIGVELAVLFCSSTSPQQRKAHFDELIKHYYDNFFEELQSLGDDSEPFFTLDDLKKEYDECYALGFALGFGFTSVSDVILLYLENIANAT
jgi:hypothetical protein